MFRELHRAVIAHLAIEDLQAAFEEADRFFAWTSGALRVPPYDYGDDVEPIEVARAAAKTMMLAVYLLVERDERRGRPGALMTLMRSAACASNESTASSSESRGTETPTPRQEIMMLFGHANLVIPWENNRDELSYEQWKLAYPPLIQLLRFKGSV